MKKILLLISFVFSGLLIKAQDIETSEALNLVSRNFQAIGLVKDQLSNLKVSSAYRDEDMGITRVYLLQTFNGLPVYNQMLVLAFKEDKLLSKAGSLLTEMKMKTNNQSSSSSVNPADAVKVAMKESGLSVPAEMPLINTSENGRILDFGSLNGVSKNVVAELMWMPIQKGDQTIVKLTWEVQVVPSGKPDWWNIHIDALTGNVIDKVNLTVYEGKNPSGKNPISLLRPNESNSNGFASKKPDFNKLSLFPPPPPTVTNADYRVIPFPLESPNFGSFAVVNNPWLLSGAGNNATTHGWHFDGTINYNHTRGNNTFAYLDISSLNVPNAATNWPDTSTTPIPSLTFTQVQDPTQQPAVTVNKKAALNNLFYWNNLMHDVYYQYGFTEAAGNFQKDNIGRGGAGNDFVQAEAQDGSGTNNANFNTPVDGSSPRMQMFLWSPAASRTTLHVNAPASIVGNYNAVESGFSTANKLANVGPVTGNVVYYDDDAAGTTHYACNPPNNSVAGKIALISRGFGGATCTAAVTFVVKVKNAQNAGAIAVIMVNNVAGAPFAMAGTDNTITIPAVMVSDVDGAIIAAQLSTGVNATLSATPAGTVNIDGDLDNGVVCHEFGHGISTRLTGGPNNSSCLLNAERGGEGWSDYMALMMTTNWATAQITDGPLARPIGTYVFGQTATSPGIRNFPYSTNLSINPLTYANMGVGTIGTESHNIGEIWCVALWEMTWSLIQQQGAINPNLFNASGTGGNSIALKLVVEGMKLQPCSPGYIDARNAILAADQNLYGGAHLCAIWAAFAKRGMGYSASQGSSASATDQTAATDLPPIPSFTAQPANVTVCAGNNATFSVTATGYQPTYNWQVSTDGGATWNNVTPANTTSTLNLTSVTGSMNNNQYRCVVTGGCPSTAVNSSAAILTVNTSNPTISAQPANVSTCVGSNATFSITATGTNTYNWQVSTDGGSTWVNVSPVNTTTSLSLTGVTLVMNNNQYRCQVTGGCPTTTINSNAGILTVTNGTISITSNPANTSACLGSNASFSVAATGASLTYNWQVSTDGGATWNNVAPAVTTSTLNLTGVTAGMNNNLYRCVVNGPGACTPAGVNSNSALLTINSPVAITSQPSNASVCIGNNATFTIAVNGTNPAYNWQVSTDGGTTWNNTTPANTTATLTLSSVNAGMNNNQYRCQVTGTCSAVAANSSAVILTVSNPISISSQPTNTTLCAGGNATFSISASGSSITYNWQVSIDGGTTWNNVTPVNTTVTLSLTGVTAGMNNNQYRCQVTSTGACTPSSINSNAALLTVNSPVTITTQPANASVCTGSNATFNIIVTGASIVYNWQVSTDGGATWNNVIPAATTSTFTITGVTAGMNNNQYRCQVSGSCSASIFNSNAAILTTNTPALVTSQPSNTSACEGSNATFSITASGSGLTYNWQVSTDGGTTWNNVIPAATTSTLTLTGVVASMNNNQYRCVVAISCNPVGVNSNAATLTVNNLPAITVQPSNAAVCIGSNATFCVTATGTNISYQWQSSSTGCGGPWTNISGATSSCYTVSGVTGAMNNNGYRCVVSGTCTPSVTSNCATLTADNPVTITVQPVNTSGCTGGSATFSVTATGTGPTYNWQVSTDGGTTWNNVSPVVTTATLTLTGVTASMNNNQYRCQVGGTCTAVPVNSNAATLSLSTTVSFTTQPSSSGVCAGTNVTFSVLATGTSLAYNWQVSTDGGTTWANVSPVNTTNSLTIVAPTVSMSGNQYRCVASGSCNPSGINSNVATLTVNTSVTLTSNPTDVVGCTGTTATFSVTATGSSIAYQWQVSVNGGPFVNLTNTVPYSGVNTNTLTIGNPGTGLNGNRYRLTASGAPCGGTVTSTSALLNINLLPVVVLTASSYANITPYVRTTLYATVSPPGNYSYQWFRNGIMVPLLTSDKFDVTVDDIGSYHVIATNNLNGCSGRSNKTDVDFLESTDLFIYPNPSSGSFQVRYFSSSNQVHTLNVYDSKGARVYTKDYPITGPYSKMEVNLDNESADVYLVELISAGGKRLATGKVIILR